MANAVWTRASSNRVSIFGILAIVATTGCPSSKTPSSVGVADETLEVGRDGFALRGVAADLERTYVALASAATATATKTSDASSGAKSSDARTSTTIEARSGTHLDWTAEIAGAGGPLARASTVVVALTGGSGGAGVAGGAAFHGEPGAAVVALDAASGKPAWRVELATTEYAIATCVAPVPGSGGVIVGGTFGGTLRAGEQVVTSAGASDGFLARIDDRGGVTWLVRFGGYGADTVQGVVATADRALFAGTFTSTAELGGKPLAPFNERSVLGDAVVGALDLAGKPAWVTTYGGKGDDAVSGIALDGRGRVAVSGTLRETVHVGGQDLVARGRSDALVAWWAATDGAPGGALRIGGGDLDAATGIVGLAGATGGFVVGGDFSARLELTASEVLVAGGGDDAFLVRLGPTSATGPNGLDVVHAWHVGGDGREDVPALAPAPGGFVAGATHTAKANIAGAALPAPNDPLAGAAIVVRAAR